MFNNNNHRMHKKYYSIAPSIVIALPSNDSCCSSHKKVKRGNFKRSNIEKYNIEKMENLCNVQ